MSGYAHIVTRTEQGDGASIAQNGPVRLDAAFSSHSRALAHLERLVGSYEQDGYVRDRVSPHRPSDARPDEVSLTHRVRGDRVMIRIETLRLNDTRGL